MALPEVPSKPISKASDNKLIVFLHSCHNKYLLFKLILPSHYKLFENDFIIFMSFLLQMYLFYIIMSF